MLRTFNSGLLLTSFIDQVLSVKNLVTYLDEYRQKNVLTGKLYIYDSEDVSLSDILRDANSFSKALISDLKKEKYEFGKAKVKIITANEKERLVYSYSIIDTVLAGYIANQMGQYLEPVFSDNLYSYRKGRSYWVPVQSFAKYTRDHLKKHTDKKKRGLYVLRRDIKSYTDMIPVHEHSPLWSKIQETFFQNNEDHYLFDLIKRIIRNEVEIGKTNYTMYLGIPTGQPMTAILYNFYAMDLDSYFDSLDGFYTRYSDDLLFCSEDEAVVKNASNQADKILSSLGLRFKKEKNGNFYFNGAGKPSIEEFFTGTECVEFLGCRINFDATVGIKQGRFKRLIREVKRKAKQIKCALKETDENKVGKSICNSLNQLFWDKNRLEEFKSIELLKRAVTDRSQLKHLDYTIAQIVSNEVSERYGVKSFRDIPYKVIRDEWGLKSFEHMRNTYGRK